MHVLIKTPTNRQTGMQIYEGQAYRGQNGVRRGVLFCLSVFTFVCVCLSTGYRARLLTNFWVE